MLKIIKVHLIAVLGSRIEVKFMENYQHRSSESTTERLVPLTFSRYLCQFIMKQNQKKTHTQPPPRRNPTDKTNKNQNVFNSSKRGTANLESASSCVYSSRAHIMYIPPWSLYLSRLLSAWLGPVNSRFSEWCGGLNTYVSASPWIKAQSQRHGHSTSGVWVMKPCAFPSVTMPSQGSSTPLERSSSQWEKETQCTGSTVDQSFPAAELRLWNPLTNGVRITTNHNQN